MIRSHLGLNRLLTVYIDHFNLIVGRSESYVFAQIRRRRCARFLLEPLEVGAKLDVIDSNLAGRREFNQARASVRPKRTESRRVKHGRRAKEPKLIF